MNSLTRWEPGRELRTMRSLMDRFFDEPFFSSPALWSQRGDNFPVPLDVIEEDGQYVVKASMPGITPEDVEITLTENVLTIKGETQRENEKNDSSYHVRERHYGSFLRHLTLPVPVSADKVEATFENGVLTLRLPKSEAAKPKKIAVKPTVDAQSQQPSNDNAS